jgi:hypothetical protein
VRLTIFNVDERGGSNALSRLSVYYVLSTSVTECKYRIRN